MKRETFQNIEYSFHNKKAKREEFLKIMDEIIPNSRYLGIQKRLEVTSNEHLPALTSVLTTVPESCLMFLITELTGNDILRTASPRCVVR